MTMLFIEQPLASPGSAKYIGKVALWREGDFNDSGLSPSKSIFKSAELGAPRRGQLENGLRRIWLETAQSEFCSQILQSRGWKELDCKVQWVQVQSNGNRMTANYTEPGMQGEVYLAVSELTLGKNRWRCTVQLNISTLSSSSKLP